MKRKIISALLVLCLVLAFLPAALAEGATVQEQPELQLAMVDRNGGSDSLLQSFHYSVGVGHTVNFYLGSGETLGTKLTVISAQSSNSDVMSIRSRDDSWSIDFLAPGSATLTVTTDDSKTYSKIITLSLPEYGFYTSASGGADSYVSSVEYEDSLKVWLLQYAGERFISVDDAVFTPDVTPNVNDGSFTPSDPGNEGYSLQASVNSGTRNVFLWVSPASGTPEGPNIPHQDDDNCCRETFVLNEQTYSVGFGFERTTHNEATGNFGVTACRL